MIDRDNCPHEISAATAMVVCALVCAAVVTAGCNGQSRQTGPELLPLGELSDGEETIGQWAWVEVDELPKAIAVFETVFWEPHDTTTLRRMIAKTPLVKDKTVLEIGTGSGLVSLCCLQAGASRVVATDVNHKAVLNARYNARVLEMSQRLEVRLVPLEQTEAFSVVAEEERFDLIISNPPWEDQRPESIGQFALYDENFALLRSILEGLSQHLNGGGKALLAYGSRDSVEQVKRLAPQYDLEVRVLDERDPATLQEVFLPAMVLEVKPRWRAGSNLFRP